MAQAVEDRLEQRVVEVEDPSWSADLNRRLTEEVRAVIGTDQVSVPASRPHPSHGEPVHGGVAQRLSANRWALGMGIGIGIVVGVIIATITRHWWVMAIAVLVLWAVTYAVVQMIMGLTSHTERPDLTTMELMEAQGVRDPEERFSEIVAEFTVLPESEHRTADVAEDTVRASGEQRAAVTPTGGRSTAVGPDGDDREA